MFGLEYNQTHNILPFIAIGNRNFRQLLVHIQYNYDTLKELELTTCS